MTTKTSINEIEFDITNALIIIENDSDLDEMFRSKYATEYSMCHSLINSGVGLKPNAEKYIKDLFEKVILERTTLREAYVRLSKKVTNVVKPEVVEDASITLNTEVDKIDDVEDKTINKKRWGLRAIEDDITNNFGGQSKQIHKTATKIQNLKKLFSRLEMRSYNERFIKQMLSDDQLRELGGAIETFETKVNSILKPKK
jgi:hypothetical protein